MGLGQSAKSIAPNLHFSVGPMIGQPGYPSGLGRHSLDPNLTGWSAV